MSYYIEFINKTYPRVMTQIDRDCHSMTFGCCDRNHWHLKIRDFASAILQQSGLSLALLYQLDFPGNNCYANEDVRKWTEGTVYYWKKIQLKDGSFNEYYPHEHGFPPTAFSLYSACEIYRRLEMKDESLKDAFRLTAKWLCRTIEQKACNQEIASITALYSCYLVCSDEWILEGCHNKRDLILDKYVEEGWFPEYGGADIGYLSVSLDMMSEYYCLSGDEKVRKTLDGMIDFISHFVHPDHTVGGEYGSRNTTYFLPNGLEVMAELGNSQAAAIRDQILALEKEPGFFMDAVDDRYCSHYLLHSFLRALERKQLFEKKGKTVKAGVLPCFNDSCTYYETAQLLCVKKGNIFCIISAGKGGDVKLYLDNEQSFIDCGWRVDYGSGKVAATNWLDPSYNIEYNGSDTVRISGRFNKVALKENKPILNVGLRAAAFLFGSGIIGWLKRKIILVDKHVDVQFEREICIKEDSILINDHITSPEGVKVEAASNFSLRHVASGKFYSVSDLCPHDSTVCDNIKDLKVEKKFSFADRKLTVNII